MPIRFRRTIKVAPGVKLNLSKGGVSTTVGSKGFHFNIGKRGIRRTVSIPGTGISDTDYIEKKETASEKKHEAATERHREEAKENRASSGESHSNARHLRQSEAAANGSSGLQDGLRDPWSDRVLLRGSGSAGPDAGRFRHELLAVPDPRRSKHGSLSRLGMGSLRRSPGGMPPGDCILLD